MMYCLICGKGYDRGTDGLPPVCNKCIKTIQVIEIVETKEKRIQEYQDLILDTGNEIKNKLKEIYDLENNIEYFKGKIKKLENESEK